MVLPDAWTWTTVGEIASSDSGSIAIGPFGSRLKSDQYVPCGVPVLRGQDITDGAEISVDSAVFVPRELADSMASCMVRRDDIVFPHRGAIGRVGIVKDTDFLMSSSMMKLTCNQEIVCPDFVFYYFRGPGRDELLTRASTVGTPGIGQPLRSLRGIPICVPPLDEQQGVARVLGALDDKIAANRKLAATAEGLAGAEFLRATMESSVEHTLSDVTELIVRGGAPKYVDAGEGIIVINQKCIRDKRVDIGPARWTSSSRVRDDRILRVNDVLVNSTGVGTLGRVSRWTGKIDATVDSHVTILRFRREIVDPVCAGFAVLHAQNAIEMMGEGSTGQTELSRDQLGKLKLRFMDRSLESRLSQRLSSLADISSSSLAECDALTALRDTLLPRLMSGELRVRDAERVVENVL